MKSQAFVHDDVRHAAPREIVDHWAHPAEARLPRPPDGQLPLDLPLGD